MSYFEYTDAEGHAFPYAPVVPRPDYEPTVPGEAEMAKYRRIMLRHDNGAPVIFVAPGGMMHSGWVIGVELVE